MAGTKISALPAASALTGAELVPVVQSGNTVQTTVGAVNTLALTGNAATATFATTAGSATTATTAGSATTATTAGSATTATTATNLAGGAAGSVPYQTGAGATALLAAGTSSQVLVSGATPAFTNTPALTGTNFTGIPNSALATISTSTTDQTLGDIFRNGDWGIGATATDIPDFTVSAANYSRIGRALSGATGGSGAAMGIVSMPYDGTPSTVYLGVTPGAAGQQRLWAGNKGTASATPTWTEFARLTSPTFTSNLGLGGISTAYLLSVAGSLTSSTTTGGINISSTVASDVTTTAYGVLANPTTAAVAFTLANFRGFQSGISLGAGSTVTNAFGFTASSLLGTNATNGYGFFSDIAAGASKFNFYANGTASNYMAGPLGLGSTSLTGFGFRNNIPITGNVQSYGNYSAGVIQSDVTSNTYYNATSASTVAASFTIGGIVHYGAYQGTFGSGSVVTNQFGYLVDGGMTGATNNYAFYSNLNEASGRWNLYMNGSAQNFINGAVGIGSTNVGLTSGIIFRVSRPLTGNVSAFGALSDGIIQSDVTSNAVLYRSISQTLAASFTLANLIHYQAAQGTFGAGSTVTTQSGFVADSSMIGAGTANYGFRGSIPASALLRYNLYMDGTAPNYMAGALGIGTPTVTGYTLRNTAVVTGATTAFGHSEEGVVQSGVTTAGYYNSTVASTVATVFTLPTLVHYRASQGTFGAGSVVTNQTGFLAEATLIGGGTTNYGFRGAIPSTAGRYNVFMDGTAQNFFQGNVGIGTGKTAPAFPLDVTGTINATYLAGAAANALSAAGTTLATATVLAAQFNAVATVAAGSGVALPNVIGVPIWVFNNQATNALLVYPFSASQTINALAAGAGFSLAAAGKIQLVQVATNVWYTMT
jgi:hypothetical protein